ncbi:MAG TPA: two-component regulator propeller domain-containing protein [Candidatus Sulfotelmatobacter sp.]|nr:two-component regulator propeller domain-containing protein [Candidatus Sulfotelmatobacter sp.]
MFSICQVLADGPPDQGFVVDSFHTEEGLPAEAVTSILQDHNGYLWIGTTNGLARFDGIHFTTFDSINTPELQDGQILSLYQDRSGSLWIGTGQGLVRYSGGRFSPFVEKDGLSSDRIICAGEDTAGHIWAGTEAGLNRLEQSRFVSFFTLEGLPDDRINGMAMLRQNLIFATGKGLAEFGGVRFGPYTPVSGIPSDDIREIRADAAGNLWLADDAGLWKIQSHGTDQDVTQVYKGTVTVFEIAAGGALWFGRPDGSLQELAVNEGETSPVQIAHFPCAISALREDAERDLWVGTANNGLYRVKRRELNVTLPIGSGYADVFSLAILSSNEMWFSTMSGTLAYWKTNELVTNIHWAAGMQVRVVSGDDHSGIWIGTLDDGLFYWDNRQLRHWDELDGLSDNDVESISIGKDRVWLGTRNGGLNCLHDGHIDRFLTPWGLTGNYAGVITEDAADRLWIGTTGDGLFCLSNGVFSAFSDTNGLPNNDVRALLADDKQRVLWAGTANGLVRLQAGRLTAFSKKDGLPDDEICQLQQDSHGNLWVGCNSGVYRLQKSQLAEYAEGRIQFIDAVPYDAADGLPAMQCIPGAQIRKTSAASDGTAWFATSKGVVYLDPELSRWNTKPPPVVLEQLLIDDVPVPPTNRVRIPAGAERIQFQYTALSLVAPEKARFRCRLDGFDRTWVNMGNKRAVQYTQVPPGHYRFRVIACNNDGVWNGVGDSLAVIVAPFWWETVRFKLLVLGIFAAFVFGILRQRRTRLREMERLRVRIAGDLHDELGSSLWSIALLSQMLKKHGKMGDEERRDADEIHRIARQTSNAIRDIVWIINPAFDTMQDLVQRMKDFAGTILRGAEYQLNCEGLNLSRRLTLGFRENVFLMYKEILTNVAKHARASSVEICLKELPRVWELSVRDDGAGFDPSAPVTGNGLQNLRRRAEKIGATIHVASSPGKGATVMLTIPNSGERLFRRPKFRQMLYENDNDGSHDNGLAG